MHAHLNLADCSFQKLFSCIHHAKCWCSLSTYNWSVKEAVFVFSSFIKYSLFIQSIQFNKCKAETMTAVIFNHAVNTNYCDTALAKICTAIGRWVSQVSITPKWLRGINSPSSSHKAANDAQHPVLGISMPKTDNMWSPIPLHLGCNLDHFRRSRCLSTGDENAPRWLHFCCCWTCMLEQTSTCHRIAQLNTLFFKSKLKTCLWGVPVAACLPYKLTSCLFVTHLLKTSRKLHFWLFEYDAPFERGIQPLYNDTKIMFLSQS